MRFERRREKSLGRKDMKEQKSGGLEAGGQGTLRVGRFFLTAIFNSRTRGEKDSRQHVAQIITVSSISSPSFLTWKGHHPLTRLCLNSDICGTLPSFLSMSSVHSLDDLAPRGNRFMSSVSAPTCTTSAVSMSIATKLLLYRLLFAMAPGRFTQSQRKGYVLLLYTMVQRI